MKLITTPRGMVEEERLQKKETVVDDDDEYTTAVEYCLLDCQGEAHKTGIAQGTGCFCPDHVHRSVHVTKKKWPEGMDGQLKDLTQPNEQDLEKWANEFVDKMAAERQRTGQPVKVEQRFTAAELHMLKKVLAARPGLGGTISTQDRRL